MLKRIETAAADKVVFTFEGREVAADSGDTVAAALLLANEREFRRTPVSGAPRGPYCLMGVCFDCLVTIDGIANRQACMIRVEDGMDVRRQTDAVEADVA